MQLKTFCPYQVGDIYLTTAANDPTALWPGTSWQALQDCVLMMAGTTYAAGGTGGSADHTLTVDELPRHSHGLNSHKHSVGAHKHTVPAHGHTYTRPTVSSSGYVASGITGGDHMHPVKKANEDQWLYTAEDEATGYGLTQTGPFRNRLVVKSNTNNGTNSFRAQSVSHTHDLPNHAHTLTGGSVADKAAFDTNNSAAFDTGAATGSTGSSGGVGIFNAPAVPGRLRLEEDRIGLSDGAPFPVRRWRDAA